MQQAYRTLRVIAEAQAIRIGLSLAPDALMLRELCTACATLGSESSMGVKAVVLDFGAIAGTGGAEAIPVHHNDVERATVAVRAVPQPVLSVVRGVLSQAGTTLVQASDLVLMAHEAALALSAAGKDGYDTISGMAALRLRYATWSVPAVEIGAEMERILAMLREKSAMALRLAKASIRLGSSGASGDSSDGGQASAAGRLEVLKQVNEFYLTHVMQTTDAVEGLRAFLEKRAPQWKNR